MTEIKQVDEGSVQSPAAASGQQIQPRPSDESVKCSCEIRYGHLYVVGDAPELGSIEDSREDACDTILKIDIKARIKEQIKADDSSIEKWIQDGCLFLYSALPILGYNTRDDNTDKNGDRNDKNGDRDEENGDRDDKNGDRDEENGDRDVLRIGEMFCVRCNELPLVVLNTLMDQKHIQDIVLQKRGAKAPSTFAKKALHELLVLPALKKKKHPRPCTWVTTCFSKWCNTCVFTPCCPIASPLSRRCKTTEVGSHSHTECASHILHGLQNLLIFGPQKHLACIEHEMEKDLEKNSTSNNHQKKDDQVYRNDNPCVSGLRQSGISIKKVENGGIRSIDLESFLWRASLYLPAFELDHNTEMILQNLIIYEKKYFRYPYQREVSSYIKFMSGIVQTKKDAKWLADYNIVVGDSKLVPKLPEILRKLASSLKDDIVLTPQLQTVEHLIRKYRPFNAFKKLFSIMILLTLTQVVFAILTFCHVNRN